MIPYATLELWVQMAKVSAFLSESDNKARAMFSWDNSPVQQQNPFMLLFFAKLVDWGKDYIYGTQQLNQMALYMYDLCGGYLPRASQIITDATGEVVVDYSNVIRIIISTQLSAVCGQPGGPVAGTYTYQNDLLKNAFNINYILVNNADEQSIGDNPTFSFNSTTGTITRTNPWFDADTLIVPYSKYLT